MTRQSAVAWAAGFIDGEGSLQIRLVERRAGQRPRHRALMQAAQDSRPCLDLLIDLFGGHVRHSAKGVWKWELAGHARLRDALVELRPYFMVKGGEADVLLEFLDLLRVGAGPGKGHVLPPEEHMRREALAGRLKDVRQERKVA